MGQQRRRQQLLEIGQQRRCQQIQNRGQQIGCQQLNRTAPRCRSSGAWPTGTGPSCGGGGCSRPPSGWSTCSATGRPAWLEGQRGIKTHDPRSCYKSCDSSPSLSSILTDSLQHRGSFAAGVRSASCRRGRHNSAGCSTGRTGTGSPRSKDAPAGYSPSPPQL